MVGAIVAMMQVFVLPPKESRSSLVSLLSLSKRKRLMRCLHKGVAKGNDFKSVRREGSMPLTVCNKAYEEFSVECSFKLALLVKAVLSEIRGWQAAKGKDRGESTCRVCVLSLPPTL